MPPMSKIPSECCLHCQFCVHYLEFERPDTITRRSMVWDQTSRERVRSLLEGGPLSESFLFQCHMWVYSETSAGKDGALVLADRRESCFFFRYRPGMRMEVAEVLEQRAAVSREAEKDRAAAAREAEEDRKLTRHTAGSAKKAAWAAIIVAAGSIICNAVLAFCQ